MMMEGRDPRAIRQAKFHWQITYTRPTWRLGRWRVAARLQSVTIPDDQPDPLVGSITLNRGGRTRSAATSAISTACQWFADNERARWLREATSSDELVT